MSVSAATKSGLFSAQSRRAIQILPHHNQCALNALPAYAVSEFNIRPANPRQNTNEQDQGLCSSQLAFTIPGFGFRSRIPPQKHGGNSKRRQLSQPLCQLSLHEAVYFSHERSPGSLPRPTPDWLLTTITG